MTESTDRDNLTADSRLDRIEKALANLTQEIERSNANLTQEIERSNERFSNYQQAIQWVVQLAFTLIASATITVIISSVLQNR